MNARPLHDRILVQRIEEGEQKIKLDGEEYLIMREDEVLAVLDAAASGKSKK
jgi:co-chaperonin GroES (HSP10)